MNYHIKYFVADSLSDMQYIILNWILAERDILIQHIVSTRIRPIEVLVIYTREKDDKAISNRSREYAEN